jgi:hypothetical protein
VLVVCTLTFVSGAFTATDTLPPFAVFTPTLQCSCTARTGEARSLSYSACDMVAWQRLGWQPLHAALKQLSGCKHYAIGCCSWSTHSLKAAATLVLVVVLVVFTPTLHEPSRSLTEQRNQHLSGRLQPVQMCGTTSRVCTALCSSQTAQPCPRCCCCCCRVGPWA